ncbi:MAG: FtsW/RodA/SpoVE family cell cycle protein [Bacteroidales bacterium]|jgi:cell division protein FtsW|nr:FtsW/RodA/SpoVE family cell cycle protein [Bacteroidales bacterium]MDD2204078.1 FtsW/RodA/SpoVE family cell cycle protein [Bacteroidales bacterium]MDD3152187.1 FtsW/RodA/SpoVE family cell cycle protein [Bacteroidales bacterium]MDD3913742.1 FtsW/RodA/SpoVE family cell cycle protein [Bacteroidales bacterium]MDD4633507.1 FtsW/RodA/SpoVE family cell cycle protein [Bacteroidales bacterium]
MVSKLFKGDKGIYAVMIILALLSLIAVYSTGITPIAVSKNPNYADGLNLQKILLSQIVLLFAGFVIMFVAERISYKSKGFRTIMMAFFIVSIVLLVLLNIFGINQHEAQRSLIIGPVSFQPIEIAKLFVIIFICFMCAEKRTEINATFKDFFIYICIPLGIVCALILSNKLSTVGIIVVTCLILFTAAKINWRYILILCSIAVVAFVVYLFLGQNRVDTWQARISNFGNGGNFPIEDPRSAIAAGGLFGSFPGNSKVKLHLNNAESDYIYSILVEEGGIMTGLFILLVYIALFLRVVKIALATKDDFGKYLAFGLGLLITIQAFIHIFVSVGLSPVTGEQLPFISKGKTSFLTYCLAIGIIQNIASKNQVVAIETLEDEDKDKKETTI